MASPIAVFITKCSTNVGAKEYNYSSSDHVFGEGQGFVYSGQKNGGEDFKMMDAIENNQEFFVYFRANKSDGFHFMGSTSDVGAPFVGDANGPLQVMIAGKNMYARAVRSNHLLTKKQDALVDFMERNGVYNIMPTGINLMKGFYVLNEVIDPGTFESAPVDKSKAYNWDIHTPFSAARLVYV